MSLIYTSQVSIPSSRVGTRMLNLSVPTLRRVSIPSSRVGTFVPVPVMDANEVFPSPQVGSEPGGHHWLP